MDISMKASYSGYVELHFRGGAASPRVAHGEVPHPSQKAASQYQSCLCRGSDEHSVESCSQSVKTGSVSSLAGISPCGVSRQTADFEDVPRNVDSLRRVDRHLHSIALHHLVV